MQLQQARNFIKKETLAQVFSQEFCEISQNAFFYRTPVVAAFVNENISWDYQILDWVIGLEDKLAL